MDSEEQTLIDKQNWDYEECVNEDILRFLQKEEEEAKEEIQRFLESEEKEVKEASWCQRREEMRSRVKEEPVKPDITIAFLCKIGDEKKRVVRRFKKTDTLNNLFDYIETRDFVTSEHTIRVAFFDRVLTRSETTLGEIGRGALNVLFYVDCVAE
jgi:vacuolar-type H+-ATPase subunit H